MAFDGEAFVTRFNTVWNGHDVTGILSMMTDDVIFEASFGKDPWGARVVGKPAVREFLEDMTGTPRGGPRYEVQGFDILALRDGQIAAKRSYRKGQL